MTHIDGRHDAHLHWPDGSHRTTPDSIKGRMLDLHERQIRRHLAEHETQEQEEA